MVFGILFSLSIVWGGTTGKLAGIITEGGSGEPVVGANIILKGTYQGAATDKDGAYFILNIPPGVYEVDISAIGYTNVTVLDIRIKIDQTTTLDYEMNPEILEGERVVVVAEKPKIEIDLTASKQTMSSREIADSWATELSDVIRELPGVNVNGGIRGGFNLDVAYYLDGMDMRDIASNTNFTSVNLTTIGEVEVLTGGWNAEYGQANGAIINVVSKRSGDRIRGIISTKVRPAGKYNWGPNIYGPESIFQTVMTTPEFWNPDCTWTTEWIEANSNLVPQQGYDGGSEFSNMTPGERAEWWNNFLHDKKANPQVGYADLVQYESELTLYGPIGKRLDFMVSARYKRGVNRYPSAFNYNPDYTLQGSFNYRITDKTTINTSVVYTAFENSGSSKTNYASTEDTYHYNSDVPYVRSPYSRNAFYLWGAHSSSEYNIRAPEYASFFNSQLKITHVFSHTTFIEAVLQRSMMNYEMHYRDIMRSAYYDDLGFPDQPADYPEFPNGLFVNYNYGRPGDMWSNRMASNHTTFKLDLTSQATPHHLIKAGGLFSLQMIDKILHDHQSSGDLFYGHLTDLAETRSYPYEGALFIQDKIEFYDVIMNIGLRMDFFNGNKNISKNGFDPLMLSDATEGHEGPIGQISWDPDGEGPGYMKIPTQIAYSPRLGISHPLSENTVLHFMYGEFNQRPGWQKIVAPPVVRVPLPTPDEGGTSELNLDPDSVLVYYNFYTHKVANPALEYEKMTQYEVGIEHNLADILKLDVTLYYKEAYNLTSRGINQGPSELYNSSTGDLMQIRMFGDPRVADGREFGKYQGFFTTYVNGAWAEVRGIEATVETRIRNFNARLNYTKSFLRTGEYHLAWVYREFDDGTKLGRDTWGGSESNDPSDFTNANGADDDTWNPHNSATLKLNLATPAEFGPALLGFHPMANWVITTVTWWSEGQRFTYYPEGYTGYQTPRNRIWKDKWNTNISIAKSINLPAQLRAKVGLQVTNLFNQKHLKLPSSESDRRRYFEEGRLSYNNVTGEPLIYDWYSNAPRMIIGNFQLEF